AAGGASETTTTERILASKASYPLCSFLPFQTASQTCGLGFIANLRQQSLRHVVYAIIGTPAPFTQGSLGEANIQKRENKKGIDQ
ncbi:MAG: hypothetical protein MR438_05640, partial [Clostridiales bacterium]|nr:hypothetical protein [Clostridiales bacterium]